MARTFPPDVIVLDTDGLLHARFGRGTRNPRIQQARAWRFPGDVFTSAVVTPELSNEHALGEMLKKVRLEAGRLDRVSILLPDAWFRMNLVDLPTLSDRPQEAMHAVRWSLKRTLPIPPESLRVAWEVLGRTAGTVKLLVVSAVEKTLASIESVFAAAGTEVVLIEPVGLNLWNAIAIREAQTTRDRVLVYVREHDFTTAVFRGAQPLFIRSRQLSGDRTVQQEIRLSASYLRDTLQTVSVERAYLAGNAVGPDVQTALASEFGAPVSTVSLRDFVDQVPSQISGVEAELTACTGVFAG